MTRYFFAANLSAVCLLILCSQTPAQKNTARAIAVARQIKASQLDAALPQQRFDEWFRNLVGPKATVTWEVNDCGEQTGSAADRGRDFPTCAEAEATLADGRKVAVMIVVGTMKKGLIGKPAVWNISIVQSGQFSSMKRLSELMKVIKETAK